MPELKSVLSVNNKPFIQGMNEAVAKGKSAGKDIGGAFGNIGARLAGVGSGIAAAFTVGAVVTLGKQVLDFAGNLQDSADALGFNADKLQGYSGAMAKSGVSAEKFAKGVGKLTQNIQEAKDGSEPMIANFKRLGISLDDVHDSDPSEILLKIADGLKNSTNSTESFAAALAILGKAGYGMIASLKQGREEFEKQAASVIRLAPEEVARLDAIGDAFTNMGISAKVAAGKAISALAELYEKTDEDPSITGQGAPGDRLRGAASQAYNGAFGYEAAPQYRIKTPAVDNIDIETARREMEERARKNGGKTTDFKGMSIANANIFEEQAKDAAAALIGDAHLKEKLDDEEADRAEKMQDASAANERDLDAANAMARIANLRAEIEEGNKLYMAAEDKKRDMAEASRKNDIELDFENAAAKKKELQDQIEEGNRKFMKEGYKGGKFTAPNDVLQMGMRDRDSVFGKGSKFGVGLGVWGSGQIQGSGPIQGAQGGLGSHGAGGDAYKLIRSGDAARRRAEKKRELNEMAAAEPMSATAYNTAMIAKSFGVQFKQPSK